MQPRGYTNRLYLDDHIPACFGRSWEPDDDDCEGCQLEKDCKSETLSRAHRSGGSPSFPQQAQVQQPQQQQPPTQMVKVVGDPNNGIIQLRDGIMLMPTAEEGWGVSLGKNVASGALSAMGYEIHRFFKRFRFR